MEISQLKKSDKAKRPEQCQVQECEYLFSKEGRISSTASIRTPALEFCFEALNEPLQPVYGKCYIVFGRPWSCWKTYPQS